jgi:hypothetical protein
MPIADDTRREIEAVLNREFRLRPEYQDFLVRWMAFNRAYNELDLEFHKGEDHGDRAKAVAVGDQVLADRWDDFSNLAARLVSLECVGGESVDYSDLLRPGGWVKGATLHLREELHLSAKADGQECDFASCRPEKRRLCCDVRAEEWQKTRMAALLRVVYQVRCNLVHGDKRFLGEDIQTNRDRALIEISVAILDRVLGYLLNE